MPQLTEEEGRKKHDAFIKYVLDRVDAAELRGHGDGMRNTKKTAAHNDKEQHAEPDKSAGASSGSTEQESPSQFGSLLPARRAGNDSGETGDAKANDAADASKPAPQPLLFPSLLSGKAASDDISKKDDAAAVGAAKPAKNGVPFSFVMAAAQLEKQAAAGKGASAEEAKNGVPLSFPMAAAQLEKQAAAGKGASAEEAKPDQKKQAEFSSTFPGERPIAAAAPSD